MTTTETSDFTCYSLGMVHASVCTSLPIEQAVDRMNQINPTGISSRWILSPDKFFADGTSPNPCPCHDHPETHKHFLLEC